MCLVVWYLFVYDGVCVYVDVVLFGKVVVVGYVEYFKFKVFDEWGYDCCVLLGQFLYVGFYVVVVCYVGLQQVFIFFVGCEGQVELFGLQGGRNLVYVNGVVGYRGSLGERFF